jgi:hypothetical protein
MVYIVYGAVPAQRLHQECACRDEGNSRDDGKAEATVEEERLARVGRKSEGVCVSGG